VVPINTKIGKPHPINTKLHDSAGITHFDEDITSTNFDLHLLPCLDAATNDNFDLWFLVLFMFLFSRFML